MDNYKINAKDAVESLEIQGLFEQLGYMRAWDKNKVCFEPNHIFAKDGVLTWLHNDPILFEKHVGKELTLPQLRDLVVLKRNDVKDATHQMADGEKFVKLSDGWRYWTNDGLDANGEYSFAWQKNGNTDEYLAKHLKPISQDPSLISGAEAHQALLAGENVQYSGYGEQYWDTALNCNIGVFLNHEKFPDFKFRIVPRTIKLELELPKPFEPEYGERYWYLDTSMERGYHFVECFEDDDVWCQFGAYHTEAEVKQVVEQLRKIRGAS